MLNFPSEILWLNIIDTTKFFNNYILILSLICSWCELSFRVLWIIQIATQISKRRSVIILFYAYFHAGTIKVLNFCLKDVYILIKTNDNLSQRANAFNPSFKIWLVFSNCHLLCRQWILPSQLFNKNYNWVELVNAEHTLQFYFYFECCGDERIQQIKSTKTSSSITVISSPLGEVCLANFKDWSVLYPSDEWRRIHDQNTGSRVWDGWQSVVLQRIARLESNVPTASSFTPWWSFDGSCGVRRRRCWVSVGVISTRRS